MKEKIMNDAFTTTDLFRTKAHEEITWDLIHMVEHDSELKELEDALAGAIEVLRPGGRLCVIDFHSLEDRIVKNAFRRNEEPCTCPPDFPVCVCGKVPKGHVLTKRPVIPSQEECSRNKRATSAKLRVFEKAGI